MEIIKTLVKVLYVISAFFIVFGGLIFFIGIGERPGKWAAIGVVAAGLCVALFMTCVGIPYFEKAEAEQAALEYRVFTADVITVQEKYISTGTLFRAGSPYIVITDGEDTVTIKVTEGIYEKYKPGDVYEHDADPVKYDATPSTEASNSV